MAPCDCGRKCLSTVAVRLFWQSFWEHTWSTDTAVYPYILQTRHASAELPQTFLLILLLLALLRATDKDNRPQTRAMMPLLLLLHCPSYHLASRWGQSNRRAMMCDTTPHHGHRSDTSRNMRALLYLVRNWAIVVITCLGNSVWDGQGKNIQNFPGCVGKSVQLSAISGMQLGKCGSNWSG